MFFQVVYGPFAEVVGLQNQLQNSSLEKSNKRSEFEIFEQKGPKIAPQKKVFLFVLVLAYKPNGHSAGVSRGRAVAVAVGVSDL